MSRRTIQADPPEAPRRPAYGVVLVDTPHLVRAGLSLLLSSQPDMEVLVDEGSSDEALLAVKRMPRRRGVVAVVGLAFGGDHDSFWLLRRLRESLPAMPVLAMASDATDQTMSQALFSGADGFVDKDSDPALFLDAVRRTAEGEVVIMGAPQSWVDLPAETMVPAPALTVRELEVLNVATEGLTSRQIGRRLGLQERTVTTHLTRIYKKLGAESRVAAVTRAAEWGLVSIGGRGR
jgi:DNA-binding NarL/FixJ family response regulator